jgi:hypothetical protein
VPLLKRCGKIWQSRTGQRSQYNMVRVKKIQNYRHKYVRRMDKDILLHLIMKYQPFGKRHQERTLKKTYRLFTGMEQVTRTKSLQDI